MGEAEVRPAEPCAERQQRSGGRARAPSSPPSCTAPLPAVAGLPVLRRGPATHCTAHRLCSQAKLLGDVRAERADRARLADVAHTQPVVVHQRGAAGPRRSATARGGVCAPLRVAPAPSKRPAAGRSARRAAAARSGVAFDMDGPTGTAAKGAWRHVHESERRPACPLAHRVPRRRFHTPAPPPLHAGAVRALSALSARSEPKEGGCRPILYRIAGLQHDWRGAPPPRPRLLHTQRRPARQPRAHVSPQPRPAAPRPLQCLPPSAQRVPSNVCQHAKRRYESCGAHGDA